MKLLTYNIHKGVGTDRRYRLERLVHGDQGGGARPDLPSGSGPQRPPFAPRRPTGPARGQAGRRLQSVSTQRAARRRRLRQFAVVALAVPRSAANLAELQTAHAARRPTCGGGDAGRAAPSCSHPLRSVRPRASLASGPIAGTPGVSSGGAPADADRRRLQRLAQHAQQTAFHPSTASARPRRRRGVTARFPAFLPLASIDKIFYRGDFVGVETRVVRGRLVRRASDHRPVVCEFHLAAGASAVPSSR